MDKTKIKQKIKIKGDDVPVFIEGEEAGVIATRIILFTEDPDNPYVTASFLSDEARTFLDEVVTVEMEKLD